MIYMASFSKLIFLCVFSTAVLAEDPSDWLPPKDGFDWVKLESGEWLKGKIKSMYNDSLEFDSDNLDLLKIDWEDIHYLRSAGYGSVNIEGIGPVAGSLEIDKEMVRVTDNGNVANFSRLNLVSLTPEGDTEFDLWAIDFTLSLNLRQGNTNQVDYTSRFSAVRRTAKSRVTLDYIGNISKTDAGTEEFVETINNNRFKMGWAVYATRYFYYMPIFAEYYRDPFQNIDPSSHSFGAFGVLVWK